MERFSGSEIHSSQEAYERVWYEWFLLFFGVFVL